MEVVLAKSAGLCFGVRRALEGAIKEAGKGNTVTLGPIIHNKFAIGELESRGVSVVDSIADCEKLPEDTMVIIRAHGVPPEVYRELDEKKLKYRDYTCPFVSKIQHRVKKEYEAGAQIIILGDSKHPEIVGINGFANNTAIILSSIADLFEELHKNLQQNTFNDKKKYFVVAQTTFNTVLFDEMEKSLISGIKNIEICNTICNATKERQKEAIELSKIVDCMIVIGDKQSSNSLKLYEICKKNQEKTFFIETIRDLVLNIFSLNDKIGITAGASTPPAIIKEAVLAMNDFDGKIENENIVTENTVNEVEVNSTRADENTACVNDNNESNTQTFEEMLALDGSLVTLHTGGVVTGTVISVVNGEVNVNLGFKSDGIIQKGEFSEDPTIDPSDVVKPGDQIEVFIVRVNDKEGNVLLSRKRLEAQKGLAEIEEAAETETVLPGRITEVVKGGVIAVIKGARAFVPSSQVSNRYVENLDSLVGKEFNFQILQYDKSKRRIVAGRKQLAAKEIAEKKEALFSSIEVGKKYDGTVSRIVDFGAFVDIGGIDGLIHISQLSWGRVKKVSSVLQEGDKVIVTVIGVDKEKEKISLTLKDIANDPWNNVEEKYPIGSIVTGKVVRMVSFGAFIELEPGLDGLVHISQIADKHVVKPDDILTIGEDIEVKVTDINVENKKISLSKKAADGVHLEESAEVSAEEASDNAIVDEPQPVEEIATEETIKEEAVTEVIELSETETAE